MRKWQPGMKGKITKAILLHLVKQGLFKAKHKKKKVVVREYRGGGEDYRN